MQHHAAAAGPNDLAAAPAAVVAIVLRVHAAAQAADPVAVHGAAAAGRYL